MRRPNVQPNIVELLQHVTALKGSQTLLSRDTLHSLLQHCIKRKDLSSARQLHHVLKEHGLSSLAFWGDRLIHLFTACGSLSEANQAFRDVTCPSVFSWNGIISVHAELGEPKQALELYDKMQQQKIEPDRVTFLAVLKASGKAGILDHGRRIHGTISNSHLDMDVVIATALIDMYAKLKSIEGARQVFDGLPHHTTASWSSMISAYTKLGCDLCAIDMFSRMLQERVSPNRVTFLCVLKACAQSGYVYEGCMVHSLVIKHSLDADMRIGNLLVDLYIKCGGLENARSVFNDLPSPDVVSWSTLIGGYASQGHEVSALELFEKSQQGGLTPNRVTFLNVLKACSSLGSIIEGRLIHDLICRSSIGADGNVASTLLDMYAKCGSLEEAQSMFDHLPRRGIVSWNVILSGYVQHGHSTDALELLDKMLHDGVTPNKMTFLCIIKACHSSGAAAHGRLVHSEIVKCDLSSDMEIGNALVDMYNKCCSLEDSKQVFNTLTMRNVVSWSAMVDGLVRQGQQQSALEYYMKMHEEGIHSDKATFSCVLRACIGVGSVKQGMLVHHQILVCQVEDNVMVGGALVDMYAKSGFLAEAYNVSKSLSFRNAATWGAMIGGYAHYGYSDMAIEAFQEMQHEGIQTEEATCISALKACAQLAAIHVGMLLHNEAITNSFDSSCLVGTALIDMYVKSACLEEARRVFHRQPIGDGVSWGALIAGYAYCEEFGMANDCLKAMKQQNLRPPEAIYTSIISSCSHGGRVAEGHHHFRHMLDNGGKPNIEQYTCLVDLLSRSGSPGEANDVIHTMPMVPDLTAKTSLLTGSKYYGNHDYRKQGQEELMDGQFCS